MAKPAGITAGRQRQAIDAIRDLNLSRAVETGDPEIATRIATVICGGEVDRGAVVDEEWLLKLEREHFVALAQMPKTQERIAHMLKTGKPLRN